jgi:enamine deaminase RidA (YjgF/YER057c/UK114 family)
VTTIVRRNPPELHTTPGYHHLTLTPDTAFLAGQCPLDQSGALVGDGDVLAQVDQVVDNIMTALADAGLTPADVVKTVIYVVTPAQGVLGSVWARLQDSPLAPAFTSASTLLGVAALGFTGQLVEIDVTAVRS